MSINQIVLYSSDLCESADKNNPELHQFQFPFVRSALALFQRCDIIHYIRDDGTRIVLKDRYSAARGERILVK